MEPVSEVKDQKPRGRLFIIAASVMSLLMCLNIIINRQLFFGTMNDPSYWMFDIFLVLTFLVGLLINVPVMMIRIIKFIFKKEKIDALLALLLIFQLLAILLFMLYPTADFYKANHKSLEKLATFVERRYGDRTSDQYLNLKLSNELKTDFKLWPIDACIKNKVIKIRVKVSGSTMGGHRFALYRSDGKNPDDQDMPFNECRPTYERKSDKWFLVDWRD